MGNSLRKLFRAEEMDEHPKTLPGIGCLYEDPRSPSNGIYRTPIVISEKKPYLETDLDTLTPPRHPRLHMLSTEVDPRSPSTTITRTPLIISEPSGIAEFESPVSIYSRFEDDLDSTSCLLSPMEPSANVSGFDALTSELCKLNLANPSSFKTPINTDLIEKDSSDEESYEERKPGKKDISPELIKEIIESFKECQEILAETDPVVKETLSKEKSSLSANDGKRKSLKLTKKPRVPLTNITSSAGNTPSRLQIRKGVKNSPNKLHFRKGDKFIKVEQSGENSPLSSLNRKYRAQWDNDTTVVI